MIQSSEHCVLLNSRTLNVTQEYKLLDTESNFDEVQYSADGQHVIALIKKSNSDIAKLIDYNVKTGRHLRQFPVPQDYLSYLRISANGGRALYESNYKATLWDITTGISVRDWGDKKYKINKTDVSPNGRYILTNSKEYSWKDPLLESLLKTLPHCGTLRQGGNSDNSYW